MTDQTIPQHSIDKERQADKDLAPIGCSILVLHGLTARPEFFEALKDSLDHSGYPCFIPHISGHRRNHPYAEEVNSHAIDLELDGYLKFLIKNPAEKIIIIGQSMGALLAIRLAARHPELIHGLILVSPSMILRSKILQVLNAFISFLPTALTKQLGSIGKNRVSRAHSGSKSSYPLTLVKHLGTFRRDAFRILPELSCPIKVIQNKGDYQLSPYSGIVVKESAVNSNVQLILRSWGELHSLLGLPEVIEIVHQMLNDMLDKKQTAAQTREP